MLEANSLSLCSLGCRLVISLVDSPLYCFSWMQMTLLKSLEHRRRKFSGLNMGSMLNELIIISLRGFPCCYHSTKFSLNLLTIQSQLRNRRGDPS